MGTLNRALKCLFEHALGRDKLPDFDDPEAWRKVSEKVFHVVAQSNGCTASEGVSWRDLYTYLSREVPGGSSTKAVDALFETLDRSSNGTVSLDEFTMVVMQRLSSLREEKELEMRLADHVPRVHVVPGSNRLNHLAKTEAFKVQVVTRSWTRNLGAVWAELDADHDGKVSIADLRRYFSRTQPGILPFLSSMFRAIEGKGPGNGKGTISFQQLLKALYPEASPADLRTLVAMSTDKRARLSAAVAEAAANDKLLAEIQGIFVVFDDDRSGELDEEEFVSAMELTGHTAAEAKGMFLQVDTDHSGSVSWEEFRDWYTTNYARYMEETQRRMLDETEDAPFGYDT
ncbi:hypothetical protein HYH03_015194 [Edaphochlamys debaryana]|uniref:EF-hand domain-containing protein n=1 Tax=Edaphochlamys debaryana TaxID=47281 RepID=A0A836BSR2_9CHLO|nr:hypothetical protein HYH03_015194 [Edaphochlamys debaryana]|eukprot:KAG2486099.1 hypothetical protein HYH03_015194 [Edaphochlamys debaryana]